MSNYFIADLHFGHSNVLRFDNRPFNNIEEHDNTIIANWNSTISPEDDVYILGDISWYNIPETIEIFKKLKGRKHWILGNHDKKYTRDKRLRDCFVEITDYKELYLNNKTTIVLSHYPIPCFNKHFYGAYMFYGHVHISFEENMMQSIRRDMEALYDCPCNMINVGVMMDYMEYTPQSFDTLQQIILNTTTRKEKI